MSGCFGHQKYPISPFEWLGHLRATDKSSLIAIDFIRSHLAYRNAKTCWDLCVQINWEYNSKDIQSWGILPRSRENQVHPRAWTITILAAEAEEGRLHRGDVQLHMPRLGQPAFWPFGGTDQFLLTAMLNSPVCGWYSAEGDYEQLSFRQRIWLTHVIAIVLYF